MFIVRSGDGMYARGFYKELESSLFNFNAECYIQWNGLDSVTKTEVFA